MSAIFFDVAGAEIDPDHPGRRVTRAEMHLDVDLVAHHVLGKRLAVMIDADASLGDNDPTVADARLCDVQLDAGRSRGRQ